ncbi:MAG: cold shock domain-containing protein [Candidatus Bathyarchaeia archaeon]
MDKRKRGVVSQYNPDKKLGFIKPEDGGKEIFFHIFDVNGGSVDKGDFVEYSETMGDKGLKAVSITVLPPLPKECLFDTFYDSNGCLKEELFYQAPEKAAEILAQRGLKSNALKATYQAFSSFAIPLESGRIKFEKAKELFNTFFDERIVRQKKRGIINKELFHLFDSHKEVALRSEEEMLGLFRYIKNIVCYFDDKQ